MAKPVARHCPNCGGPLVLDPSVTDVTCQYCGNVAHFAQPSAAAARAPTRGQGAALIGVLGGVIALTSIGGATAFFMTASPSGVRQSVEQAMGATRDFPISCGMNDEVVIADRTFEGTGTLITGDVNCKVRIKNSKLKADTIVLAKNLVEIHVENSTLEGKEAAVQLGMNSKLFVTKQSTLRGGEAGVRGGINSELTLTDSSVEGGEHGVRSEVNFKLHATSAKISGKEYGILAANNFELEGKELTLSGERAALAAEVNLKADLRGGLLQGGEAGIQMKGPNLRLKLSRGAKVQARESAIRTGSNFELEMEDALIDGGEIGIETEVNPKLNLGPKARVHGKSIALKAGVNLELRLRGASLESESVAVCAPFNVELTARDSTIRGGSDAFRLQRRPNELTLTSTTVTGKQLFNVRSCSATP